MEEYLYHVTREDEVLGKVERSKAHSEKLLHRSGVVLVFNTKKELFLAKRSPKKKIFPDCFDCACSFHVKYGQTYDEAAQAELLEETKLTEKPKYVGKFVLDEDPDYLIVAVYALLSDKKITLDPEEAISGKYYPMEEAEKIIRMEKTTHWLPKAWECVKGHE